MLEIGPAEVRLPLRSAGRDRRGRVVAGRAGQAYRRLAGRRIAVVHGLPQRRRIGRRDVRQRGPRVRPVPAGAGADHETGGPRRDPVRTPGDDLAARMARSGSRWVRWPSATAGAGHHRRRPNHCLRLTVDVEQSSCGELRRRSRPRGCWCPAPTWAPEEQVPAGGEPGVRSAGRARHVGDAGARAGVGETRSCGTGTVAAAAAAHVRGPDGRSRSPVTYRVDVPGGTVEVELTAGSGVPDRPGGPGRPRRGVLAGCGFHRAE